MTGSLSLKKSFIFNRILAFSMGFPRGSYGKESCLQCRRPVFNHWVSKKPWRREWLPTPVSLSGEFYGQRSLAGYSPWACKEPEKSRVEFGISKIQC